MSEINKWAAALLIGLFLAALGNGCGWGAQKKSLGNGLTVILDRDTSSATTILEIVIRGGMRAEPAGKAGLAFLTTRLSIEIPDSDKAQDLVSLATRFSVTSAGDNSIIHIECLSSNLEPSLKILSRIFLDPLFSGIRIDAVKKHMEHQGRIEEDDSVALGHLTALRALFAGSGYGGSSYGDEVSLGAIKNRDVSDFYKSLFVGSNMIMTVSSDFPEETLLSLVSQYFTPLPSGQLFIPNKVPAPKPTEKLIRLDRDTQQAFISAVYPLPALTRRSFVLASILETALGKGQGSRLWPLRADGRLAYNVNCRATQMQDQGLLEAYLETDAAKEEAARESLRAVMGELFEKGMTDEELLSVKTAAKADFLRDTEARLRRVSVLAFFESTGLGSDFYEALFPEIDALGLDEVNAGIRDILAPDKAFEVVIGPRPGG
jgi:zinc protease